MKTRYKLPLTPMGFTLVELLVVVAVLALLASIVFSNLGGAREGADLSKRRRDTATSDRLSVCGQDQMMDVDGNLYDTVDINGVCWMAENLAYLPEVSPPSAGSETDPHYYVYGYQGTDIDEAKATANYQEKGVLYNWPAAMEACPPGTRLPTDEEQHILESAFSIGTCDPDRSGAWDCDPAGTKLKSSSGWDGDNASGFSAIPAGARSTDGGFYPPTLYSFFWSSSESSAFDAWRRLLLSTEARVGRDAGNKGFGFSVRCVR